MFFLHHSFQYISANDGNLSYEQYYDSLSIHAIPQFSTSTTKTVCQLKASSKYSNFLVAPIVLKPFYIILELKQLFAGRGEVTAGLHDSL
jgi:hypothetical protein